MVIYNHLEAESYNGTHFIHVTHSMKILGLSHYCNQTRGKNKPSYSSLRNILVTIDENHRGLGAKQFVQNTGNNDDSEILLDLEINFYLISFSGVLQPIIQHWVR